MPDSADFDGNDVVNGSDFLTWQQNFGTVGPLATHANGDDQINDADLAVWESQYGSSPLSAIGAVPEPGSVLLVVVAGLFLFCHRVHREHGEKENHSFSASVSSVLSVAILFLLLPTATQAQPPVPPGVEPGESYHLMFVDSTDVFVGTFEFVPPFLPVFGGLDAADWTVTFYASQGGLIVGWNQTDIL